jgi:hypothetical protein
VLLKKVLLTVKTVTIGLKARKILRVCGIKSSLVKIDYTKSENGCQYGLEFDERDFYEVISALKKHKINYGVYKPK